MKPFSITAPEEIAKEYGGDKRKIQQAAAQGLIDPTSAVLAGMFIDRIRGAAAAEQAPQATVAEQVMNPQPQMPSAGLAAAPQAAQMQQPMPPRMGQPSAPQMPQPAQPQMAQAPQMPPQQPQGMAMGGGLDSIDFVEQAYAPGGLVSFQVGGGYGETMQQLRNQLSAARTQAQRDQIQGAMNQLRAQYEQPSLVPNMSAGPAREGLAAVDVGDPLAMGAETFADTQRPINPYDPEGRIGFEGNRFDTGTFTGKTTPETKAVEPSMDFGLGFTPATSTDAQQRWQSLSRRPPGGLDVQERAELFELSKQFGRFQPETKTEGLGSPDLNRSLRRNVLDPLQENIGAPIEGFIERAKEGISNFAEDPIDAMMKSTVSPENYAKFLANREAAKSPDAYTGATMPAEQVTGATPQFADQPAGSTQEDRRGSVADQIARMQGDTADTTQAAPDTIVDQIKATNDAAKAGEIDSNTAVQQQSALVDQLASISGDADEYMKKAEELLTGKKEKGEFRKETEALVKNRAERLKEAKSEAFNMALLQAGLGMLGQGGGQTALQALGKAALPAVKDAAASIKDAKKEDRELLQLGLAMEQMDDKQLAESNRALAGIYGDRAKSIVDNANALVRTQIQVAGQKDVAETQAGAQNRLTGVMSINEEVRQTNAQLASLEEQLNARVDTDIRMMRVKEDLIEAEKRALARPDDPERQQRVADLRARQQEIRTAIAEETGLARRMASAEQELEGLSNLRRNFMPNITPGTGYTPSANIQSIIDRNLPK